MFALATRHLQVARPRPGQFRILMKRRAARPKLNVQMSASVALACAAYAGHNATV